VTDKTSGDVAALYGLAPKHNNYMLFGARQLVIVCVE